MLEPDEQSVRRWQWSGRQGEIIHRNETSARAGLLPPSGYNRLFHFRICLRQADGKQYAGSKHKPLPGNWKCYQLRCTHYK